jgi:hypothetical protein
LGLLFGTTAYADEADQQTKLTFSAPVEIPGHVLPAGTYIFRLADNGSDPNIVQILNSDGTRVYATLQTLSADRQNVRSDTTITLAEQGAGRPDALLRWYYPGSEIGHEFLYAPKQEKQLAHDRREVIASNSKGMTSEAKAAD